MRSHSQLKTGQPASVLISSLQKNNPDTTRLRLLLQLSRYYYFQRADSRENLDTVLIFLQHISLSDTSPNHYLLSISDKGVGMPAQTRGKRAGSLGMSLMAGLAEDLEGNSDIANDNGTTIKISFVHDVNIKRADPLVSSVVTSN